MKRAFVAVLLAALAPVAELDYPEALQELALGEPDPRKSEALMRAAAHAMDRH